MKYGKYLLDHKVWPSVAKPPQYSHRLKEEGEEAMKNSLMKLPIWPRK